MCRFKRRCADSVDVEDMYSMLFVNERDSDPGSSVVVLTFSERTVGKWLLSRAIASSTRPDNICVRISER